MKRFFCFLLVLLAGTGFGQNTGNLIPKPASFQVRPGQFVLRPNTILRVPSGSEEVIALAGTLADRLRAAGGPALKVQNRNQTLTPAHTITFVLVSDPALGAEGYRLDVQPDSITIEAARPAGFFYALQTLYQLMPPEIFGNQPSAVSSWAVPACRIEDRPRFAYRGLHLDVSRHFFSVSFVKKYLDLMAFHKLNTFHWHLTDDQGWRIEIKRYPKLTEIGSRRKETIIGHYYESDPQQFDGRPYGGFYTQEEIREVVRYARERYITVVPEIEMPGHAVAALAAYPELGCSGGPYEVATKWGIFSDVFCPYEKTFTFLQEVLTEVMDLFPGPYIHIGGDECPKASWKASPYCQALMRRLKLKNEQQLQSYFIGRIDRWVQSKGRKIIGWDEILEGGLSAGATVMSWRGTKGGITAARQGHDAIMTPGEFVYFDYYQSDPTQEPLAFGGFTPIGKTYSFEPVPEDLPAAVARRIIGAQANVWTEYIPTPEKVEYMVWPRAAALAEVVWTPREGKSWEDFSRRMRPHFRRLEAMGVRFSRAFFDVVAESTAATDGTVRVRLTAKDPETEIRYTLDGSEPTALSLLYAGLIHQNRTGPLKAVAVRNGTVVGEVQSWWFAGSKGTGKPVRLTTPAIKPAGVDPGLLTDGRYGYTTGYLADMRGIAQVRTADLEATIDLARVDTVRSVRIGLVRATAGNVRLPRQVEVAVSGDGRIFRTLKTVSMNPEERGRKEIVRPTLNFEPTPARFVRVTARNAGAGGWVAADEIEVN
ncbi:glycoside hydrolase family 20 protein [Larkinella soli]|uniref:glycoside hydrolase family 20 protein n=1 Tax=Larkinella soli TaxID=1770527 RepID=UPI0013E2AF0C|nr:family 20 glycosylhydrolase [Larkinella soli]